MVSLRRQKLKVKMQNCEIRLRRTVDEDKGK